MLGEPVVWYAPVPVERSETVGTKYDSVGGSGGGEGGGGGNGEGGGEGGDRNEKPVV